MSFVRFRLSQAQMLGIPLGVAKTSLVRFRNSSAARNPAPCEQAEGPTESRKTPATQVARIVSDIVRKVEVAIRSCIFFSCEQRVCNEQATSKMSSMVVGMPKACVSQQACQAGPVQ